MKRAVLAFCVAVAGMLASTHSFATTLTLSFSGTVNFVNNAGVNSGVAIGDPVSGSMTLHVTNPSINDPNDIAYLGSADYELTGIDSTSGVGGRIENVAEFNHYSLDFNSFGNIFLELEFGSSTNNIPLFHSLSDIPDVAALIALYGGASGLYVNAPGGLHAPHYLFSFSIDEGHLAVSDTPIPATLPLFASALAGLGFVGWKRGKNAAVA